MNEPVFGDPSRIRAENKRSIFKGVGFGCGGCAIMIILAAGLLMSIVALIFWLLFKDEASKIAFQQAQASSAVKQALGEPIERGWFSTGQSKTLNGHSTVDLQFMRKSRRGESGFFRS
jgi:hypothetical protein